jgi:hypothetical protein
VRLPDGIIERFLPSGALGHNFSQSLSVKELPQAFPT